MIFTQSVFQCMDSSNKKFSLVQLMWDAKPLTIVRSNDILFYWYVRASLVSIQNISFLSNLKSWYIISLLYGCKFLILRIRKVKVNVSIIGSSWNVHQTFTLPNACSINSFMSKSQKSGSQGRPSFFSWCPPCGSVSLWPTRFIFGTNITHEVKKCRTPFPGSKVRSSMWQESFEILQCPLHDVVPI